MAQISYTFTIDGEQWLPCHLERLEYERNLHILHQMKQHGVDIRQGNKMLTDDDIDCLTANEAWEVSVAARTRYSGSEIAKFYAESFHRSDEFWKKLKFDQNKPMKVSHCHLEVHGLQLQAFMQAMGRMKQDESVLLKAHPEHFTTVVTDEGILGIEPFGMYGTPTLVKVDFAQASDMGPQIQADRLPDYPIVTTGKAFLSDGVTEINTPFHQMKPLADGFAAELAVYWPEGVPDELVSGHSLHLAMEFYEALRSAE